MGGAALIVAAKYDIVCVLGRGSVCVDVWVWV